MVFAPATWLKSVSWDDFKTWQAGVAAFLAQDARPPLEPITCSEELFAKSLPDLSDISISVRLLHGCTLIGSHDGCAQEFKLHRYGWAQEAVFDLYALDALALNDCHSHPCLMPYDRSYRAYCSCYGPEVEPYAVNSILQRVFKEFDDPLSGTFSELRVVVFLTLGSKMVRVLDSPPDMTRDIATVFTTTQDLPLAFLRAEHVCGRSTDEGQEFPADPAAATWGVETRLDLDDALDSSPECSGQVRLTITLTSSPSVSMEGDDWAPSTLFLRRLFAARLEIDSDSNPSLAPAAPENGA